MDKWIYCKTGGMVGGGWSKAPNFACFLICSIECLGETDFAQLIEASQMIMRTHFDTVKG